MSTISTVSVDVFVVYETESALSDMLKVITKIRNSGLSSIFSMEGGKLSAQLKKANKHGSKWVVIVKLDDKLTLRDMKSGNQYDLTLNDIISKIKENK